MKMVLIKMPRAFILINANLGTESALVGKLKKMPHVKQAYFVYGVYDVIAEIEAETIEQLKEVIAGNIRGLDEVRSTLTMVVIE
jgi:DNA-binding Lrp family transcriptional regulator